MEHIKSSINQHIKNLEHNLKNILISIMNIF